MQRAYRIAATRATRDCDDGFQAIEKASRPWFVSRPDLTMQQPQSRIDYSRAIGLGEKGLARMRFRLLERGLRRAVRLVMGTAVTAVLLAAVPHRGAIADEPGRETPVTVAAPGFTPAEARLKADVTFLAADAREGRRRGQAASRMPPATLPTPSSNMASSPRPMPTATSRSFRSRAAPTWESPRNWLC